ncbi:hypothetical protein Tco_0914230 [Tanacetum coccineum]
MLTEGDNWGIDPLEFIWRVNSSFDKHMKIDGRTKKILFYAWMNESWNKRRMDDDNLNNNNTTTDSFFKPYLITHGKCDTKKEDEQSQTKRIYINTSESIDEQPNKRMCKAKKFEAIQYSLGPNEEYIAIRRCEYDTWERNEDNMSKIYQDIFPKKDNGWKDIGSKEINEVGEVSIIRSPMCDCRHAGIQKHLQHKFLLINSTWRIYRANIRGVSHSNSF